MPPPSRTTRPAVDQHIRIAAWLHIALGVLALGLSLFLGLGLVMLGTAAVSYNRNLSNMAPAGMALVGLVLVGPPIEIYAAIRLLRSGGGRVITVIASVIHLLNFPVGSAISIYTFWALFRDLPPAPVGAAAIALPLPSTHALDNQGAPAQVAAARQALADKVRAARARPAATLPAAPVRATAATDARPAAVRAAPPAAFTRPAAPTAAATPVAAAAVPPLPRRPRPS